MSVFLERCAWNALARGNVPYTLVCRIRPSDNPSAWDVPAGPQAKTIKLLPQHCKSSVNPPQDFRFDEILTGSENKPVYNAVARSHVCAAMDGFNAVIFAYGQTASGKTFTLVSVPYPLPSLHNIQHAHAEWRRRPTGYHPACHEGRFRVHPAHAVARVPPAMLIPRDLQRDDPRPARAAVLIRLAAGADPGHGQQRHPHATPRGGRHEPQGRARGPPARRGQPPHGEHGLERTQQPQP